MRGALRHSGFRRLFAATSTSMFGDSVMLLVFSIWVKELTGSNGAAGLTFFWMVLPSLLAPALGGPIDRVRRRPLLVWGNVASAVIVLPLLLVRDAGDVWIVWSVAFLYGVSFIVLPAGLNGFLKELLPEDLLVEANGGLQTVREGFRLIGPLIGAGLYAAAGGWAVALVDAATFLVAAVLIARIRLTETTPEPEPSHWRADLTVGLRHLVRDPVLQPVLVGLGAMMLVIGFAEASIFAILDAFGLPTTFAGVLVTVQGVGAVAGGLTASRVIRRIGEPRAVLVSLLLIMVSLGLVAATSVLPLMVISLLSLGYALPLLLVALTTLVQIRTPQRIMGRVSTTMEVLLGTPQALSLAVGAALVTVLDYHLIFAIMAAVTGLGAAYLATRMPDRAPAPVDGAAGAQTP
jgi:MFS family permease